MAFTVCQACGAFSARHQVVDGDPGWAVALCPACGAGAPFRRLPLFVMTGPSGAGKSTTCRLLMHSFPECVVLESDILYGSLEMSGDDGLRRYWDAWLRLVMNVHQAARPVLLCGTLVPSLLESLPSQAYLGGTHYAALTCEDVDLERRLRARPAWRGCDDAFIAEHVRFNQWFRSTADPDQPPISLIDTTGASVEESADEVRRWVRARL